MEIETSWCIDPIDDSKFFDGSFYGAVLNGIATRELFGIETPRAENRDRLPLSH